MEQSRNDYIISDNVDVAEAPYSYTKYGPTIKLVRNDAYDQAHSKSVFRFYINYKKLIMVANDKKERKRCVLCQS